MSKQKGEDLSTAPALEPCDPVETDTVETVGERLRAAREARSLELRDVAAKTRQSQETLAALESSSGSPRPQPLTRSLVRGGLAAATAGLLAGGILFVLLPRYEAGLGRYWSRKDERLSGKLLAIPERGNDGSMLVLENRDGTRAVPIRRVRDLTVRRGWAGQLEETETRNRIELRVDGGGGGAKHQNMYAYIRFSF